jgi:hypothetical protein
MAVVRTNVSEERIISIIMVGRISELGAMLLVTANVPGSPILLTMKMVIARVTRCHVPEYGTLHI